jgi:hypothetical protein
LTEVAQLTDVSVVAVELSPMTAGAPMGIVRAAAQVSGTQRVGEQVSPAVQLWPAPEHAARVVVVHVLTVQQALGHGSGVHVPVDDNPPLAVHAAWVASEQTPPMQHRPGQGFGEQLPP